MFCPKCGSESVEAQRFCKACGTNLQLINNALGSSDKPFGIDVDSLARNAREFAESFKNLKGAHIKVGNRRGTQEARDKYQAARDIKRQVREETRRQNLPKPREYMGYSWQHNLKNGLISLFWGCGLGVFLYYLSQNAIDDGLIRRLEETSNGHVQGLEPLVRMIWMIAFLPVLKGLAQIIYASFFAESMATLTERFTPKLLPEPPQVLRQDTAPVADREPVTAPASFDPSTQQPPSVTEHTTHFFDE